MPKVLFTATARYELKEIWRYIARDNVTAANKLENDIYKKCETYAVRPDIGRLTDEYGEGVRHFPHGRYVIFYVPHDDGITILHVWHGSRNLPDLIRAVRQE